MNISGQIMRVGAMDIEGFGNNRICGKEVRYD